MSRCRWVFWVQGAPVRCAEQATECTPDACGYTDSEPNVCLRHAAPDTPTARPDPSGTEEPAPEPASAGPSARVTPADLDVAESLVADAEGVAQRLRGLRERLSIARALGATTDVQVVPDPRDARIAELESKLAPYCDVCGNAGADLRTNVEVCRDCYDVAATKAVEHHDYQIGILNQQLATETRERDEAMAERDEAAVLVGGSVLNARAAIARAEKAEEALEMAESYLGGALAYHATPESCDCGRCAVLVAVRAARKEKK